jgi:hypothetical protein
MLAANPTSISKSVPVSDLCVLCVSVFSSPNLSPFTSDPSTRNLVSFVDALDAASSISPLFATLTKNTRGEGVTAYTFGHSLAFLWPTQEMPQHLSIHADADNLRYTPGGPGVWGMEYGGGPSRRL